MAYYVLFLNLVIILLFISLFYLIKDNKKLKDYIYELEYKKRSNETKHGKIFENLIPFSSSFPFDPAKFKFIGDPVDGVVFDDDIITFVEIKMNKSNLSSKQRKIKELIKNKRVEWFEIRGN